MLDPTMAWRLDNQDRVDRRRHDEAQGRLLAWWRTRRKVSRETAAANEPTRDRRDRTSTVQTAAINGRAGGW
jgi:hypothetical protein